MLGDNGANYGIDSAGPGQACGADRRRQDECCQQIACAGAAGLSAAGRAPSRTGRQCRRHRWREIAAGWPGNDDAHRDNVHVVSGNWLHYWPGCRCSCVRLSGASGETLDLRCRRLRYDVPLIAIDVPAYQPVHVLRFCFLVRFLPYSIDSKFILYAASVV